MSTADKPALVRAIGRWSLAALLLNLIIGSGIFGLPSVVAGLLGPASTYAYLIAAAGIGIIRSLGEALDWPMKLDPIALTVAVMTSAMTGIAFGFFPARRAAALDPIVALRHE